MRILVTGHLGLIGRHLVPRLLEREHAVAGVDVRHDKISDARVRKYRVDLCECDPLRDAFADFRPEAVIHLAARTDLNEKHNLEGYAANVGGVANLIEAVRETPSVKRLIATSSQLVCKVGYVPRDEFDYCPHTLYGQSKVLTEKTVREADGGGVTWCITRPTTVWGPHMSEHYQRLLALIAAGKYVHIGREPLWKSYSYAGNIAYQYERLCTADAEQIHRRAFYLADYEPLTLQSWTNALATAMNAPGIRTCPRLVARPAAWAGDMLNNLGLRFPLNSFRLNNILTQYVFDLAATRKVCGELPYSFEEGVQATAAWYQSIGRELTTDYQRAA